MAMRVVVVQGGGRGMAVVVAMGDGCGGGAYHEPSDLRFRVVDVEHDLAYGGLDDHTAAKVRRVDLDDWGMGCWA